MTLKRIITNNLTEVCESKTEKNRIAKKIVEEIREHLQNGEKVRIQNVGVLSTRIAKARTIKLSLKNVKEENKTIYMKERRLIKFRNCEKIRKEGI